MDRSVLCLLREGFSPIGKITGPFKVKELKNFLQKHVRFHLITLISALLLAGICLGLNLKVRGPLIAGKADPEYWWGYYRGWPLPFQALEHHHVIGHDRIKSYKDMPTIYEELLQELPKDSSGKSYFPDVSQIPETIYTPGAIWLIMAVSFNILIFFIFCIPICIAVELLSLRNLASQGNKN